MNLQKSKEEKHKMHAPALAALMGLVAVAVNHLIGSSAPDKNECAAMPDC